jgi:hypothetical protein
MTTPSNAMTATAAPSKGLMVMCWILQIAAAVILAQTLYFKFTGAPEAKHIFTTLGVEPWGRIGAGVVELIAAVLLVVPRLVIFGAGLSVGVMVGAIGSHLGPLGTEIVVPGQGSDGGLLFVLAIGVLVCSLVVLVVRRAEVVARVRSLAGGSKKATTAAK